jgi:hypothetical protein
MHESMAGMGVVSKAIDKLPTCVRVIFLAIAISASAYYIAHYGFLSFLMRMIFSQDI